MEPKEESASENSQPEEQSSEEIVEEKIDDDQVMNTVLNLHRRLPPQKSEKNIGSLCGMLPEQTELILNCIQSPLSVEEDPNDKEQRSFICSEYNRDGDSYRSPWTNEYYPETSSDFFPDDALRRMEIITNAMVQEYEKLYYRGALASNAYFWNKEGKNFSCCVATLKEVENQGLIQAGTWSSLNVIDVVFKGKNEVEYSMLTDIMIQTGQDNHEVEFDEDDEDQYNLKAQRQDGFVTTASFNVAGSVTQKNSSGILTLPENQNLHEFFHITNIMSLVEEKVNSLRKFDLEMLFLSKSRQGIAGCRAEDEWGFEKKGNLLMTLQLANEMRRGSKSKKGKKKNKKQ